MGIATHNSVIGLDKSLAPSIRATTLIDLQYAGLYLLYGSKKGTYSLIAIASIQTSYSPIRSADRGVVLFINQHPIQSDYAPERSFTYSLLTVLVTGVGAMMSNPFSTRARLELQ